MEWLEFMGEIIRRCSGLKNQPPDPDDRRYSNRLMGLAVFALTGVVMVALIIYNPKLLTSVLTLSDFVSRASNSTDEKVIGILPDAIMVLALAALLGVMILVIVAGAVGIVLMLFWIGRKLIAARKEKKADIKETVPTTAHSRANPLPKASRKR